MEANKTAAAEKLQAALSTITTRGFGGTHPKHEEIDVHPTAFIRDGVLHVSAEDGQPWADYYGEHRGGYPWINPKLEEFAKQNDGFWEWVNPGCIAFYSN